MDRDLCFCQFQNGSFTGLTFNKGLLRIKKTNTATFIYAFVTSNTMFVENRPYFSGKINFFHQCYSQYPS